MSRSLETVLTIVTHRIKAHYHQNSSNSRSTRHVMDRLIRLSYPVKLDTTVFSHSFILAKFRFHKPVRLVTHAHKNKMLKCIIKCMYYKLTWRVMIYTFASSWRASRKEYLHLQNWKKRITNMWPPEEFYQKKSTVLIWVWQSNWVLLHQLFLTLNNSALTDQ